MRTALIIKINFLILGLFVVIMLMINLNKNGLPQGFRDFLGATGESQILKIKWCETRVEALISPDKFKLEQVRMKWFVEDTERRQVHDISVEKWFSRYCSVKGELLQASALDLNSFTPVLFVKFITSKVEALGRSPEGAFLWRGQAFKSEELAQALTELGQFAHPR